MSVLLKPVVLSEITETVKRRRHAALVIANQCEVPAWLVELQEESEQVLLPSEVLEQLEKHDRLFEERSESTDESVKKLPKKYTNFHGLDSAYLRGVFTDAFAIYHSLRGIAGMESIKLLVNCNGQELDSALNELFLGDYDDLIIYYCGFADKLGRWVCFDLYRDAVGFVTLQTILSKWRKLKKHRSKFAKQKTRAHLALGADDDDDEADPTPHESTDTDAALARLKSTDLIEAEILAEMNEFEKQDSLVTPSAKTESSDDSGVKTTEISSEESTMKTGVSLASVSTGDTSEDDRCLLIVSDANHSGVWVKQAIDEDVLRRDRVIVQSAVEADAEAIEVSFGHVIPDSCWMTEIHCGHFSRSWIDICTNFNKHKQMPQLKESSITKDSLIVGMLGSFVMLSKSKVWDDDEENDFANDTCPMSNILVDESPSFVDGSTGASDVIGKPERVKSLTDEQKISKALGLLSSEEDVKSQEHTAGAGKKSVSFSTDPPSSLPSSSKIGREVMVCFPCYGAPIVTSQKAAARRMSNAAPPPVYASAAVAVGGGSSSSPSSGLIAASVTTGDGSTIDGTYTTSLSSGSTSGKKSISKRNTHVPQPSVRRMGVLQGIKAGLGSLKKPDKKRRKKSSHFQTKTRGGGDDFLFTKVLAQIRTIVVGDEEEDEYAATKDEVDAREWIDA